MARKILLLVLCIVLPPIGVGLIVGITFHFWLSLALTLLSLGTLGWIHGLYVFLTKEPQPL